MVPVAGQVPAGNCVTGRELPAVKEMACTVHQGDYNTIGGAYSLRRSWGFPTSPGDGNDDTPGKTFR